MTVRRRRARFKVIGRLDAASVLQVGTVTIEPSADGGVFRVRPLRRKRDYALPLADVARMVVFAVAWAEKRQRERERAAARRKR